MKSTALPRLSPGPARQRSLALVFLAGAIIGVLGGMIGLGSLVLIPLLVLLLLLSSIKVWNHD